MNEQNFKSIKNTVYAEGTGPLRSSPLNTPLIKTIIVRSEHTHIHSYRLKKKVSVWVLTYN